MGFQAKFGTWPVALSNLGGSPATCSANGMTTTSACLLDDALSVAFATGTINGYTFTYLSPGANGEGFTLVATPIAGAAAKVSYFASDGIAVHYATGSVPTAASPIIGN
jgi:hypothetical protein